MIGPSSPLIPQAKMGASASKSRETKSFAPSQNIQYGQGLVDALSQSTETDFSRSQSTEAALQKEVSRTLDSLTKESDSIFNFTLKNSLLQKDTDQDKDISSVEINNKINKLSKVLESKNDKFLKLTDDVIDQKKEIVNCLIKNSKQPLNCWDEVKNFEKLVNDL